MAFEQSLLIEINSTINTITTNIENDQLSSSSQQEAGWLAAIKSAEKDQKTYTEKLNQISQNNTAQRETAKTNLTNAINEIKENIQKIDNDLTEEQNTTNNIDQTLKTIKEKEEKISILQSQSDPVSQNKLLNLNAELVALQIESFSLPAQLEASRKKIESLSNEKNALDTKLKQLTADKDWLDQPAGVPAPKITTSILKSYTEGLTDATGIREQLRLIERDIPYAQGQLRRVQFQLDIKKQNTTQFLQAFNKAIQKILAADITEQQLNIIHQELLNMLARKAITNQVIKDSIKRLCDLRLAYRDRLRLSAAADHLCFSGFDEHGKVIIPTQAQIDKATADFLSSINISVKKGGIFVRGSDPHEIEKAIAYAVTKLGWAAITITANDGKQQTVDAAAEIAIRMGVKVVGVNGAEKALQNILKNRADLPLESKIGSITDHEHNELARLYAACAPSPENMDLKNSMQTKLLETEDSSQIASMICNLPAADQDGAFNLLASILNKKPASVRHNHLEAFRAQSGEGSYIDLAVKLLPKISNGLNSKNYLTRRTAKNELEQLFPQHIPVSNADQTRLINAAGGNAFLRAKLTEAFPITAPTPSL